MKEHEVYNYEELIQTLLALEIGQDWLFNIKSVGKKIVLRRVQ